MEHDGERSSIFSVAEIVGIAAAGAVALGGIVVALGRAQSHAARMPAAATSTADSVGTGLQRGRDAARGAAEMIAERLPSLKESAADRLSQAASRVQHDSARLAEVAGAGAEHARVASAALIERMQDTVGPALSGAAENVSNLASDARDSAQPAASGILDSVSANAGRAVEKSTDLARETLAALFWLLAASALVYLAILSPERREKLKGFIFGAIEETRMLVRDFQGYDEDI